MSDEGGEHLYRLMSWFSPAYPVGAYSYSHGIEYAVETGLVRDRESLVHWIGAILRHGAGASDGALIVAAYRAGGVADMGALLELAELAGAWRASSELSLESQAQGRAFLTATKAAWPDPFLEELAASLADREIAYPVAVGAAAASAHIPLSPLLVGYFQAFAGNLVSAAVRLIPLGQTDGQRALRALLEPCRDAALRSVQVDLEETGTAAPMVDWTSMRHETQYTRLFRS